MKTATMIRLSFLALIFTLGMAGNAQGFETEIQVAPNVLNLENQGTVVTVHTEIPFVHVVASSVLLNGVQIDWWKADNRGNFVAKFVMNAIKAIADPDPDAQPNLLTLIGVTDDGVSLVSFFGECEVRVVQIIPKGR